MVDFAVEAQRERRQDAARGDPRSLPGPLPADHDDDDGGAGRHAADRAGLRRRRRIAAAARPGGGRRPARVAAADALHHAGLLRLHRRRAPVAGGPPAKPGTCAGRGAHTGAPHPQSVGISFLRRIRLFSRTADVRLKADATESEDAWPFLSLF